MAHDHAHDHSHGDGYYLDQLCTIAACGLIGGIAFLTWKMGLLTKYEILVPKFNLPVLIGGCALLVFVVIRAVTLWGEVGQKKRVPAHAHDHGHEHDHDHDHGHAHKHNHDHKHDHHHHHDGPCDHDHGPGCDHDHHHHEHAPATAHAHLEDHGHDHGFAPWRYAILLLPVMLGVMLIYFDMNGLKLGFSDERLKDTLGKSQVTGLESVAGKEGPTLTLGFQELSEAAYRPNMRQYFEGRNGRLKGLFWPLGSNKEFTLFRMKMTCCASDAIPLKVQIISPEDVTGLTPRDWVEVTGQIQFRKVPETGEYIPVLQMKSRDDVKKTDPDNSFYTLN